MRELVDATTPEEQRLVLAKLGSAKGGWKGDYVNDDRYRRSVWDKVIAVAEKYNDPGTFTTFIGFEWTADPMIHRNVLFADDARRTGQVMPMTKNDSGDPEDLWRYLAGYEASSGGRVMAIPHNANLSGGMMFTLNDQSGKPFSTAYARTRARWEPVYEATQYKGDSETYPQLSPQDEFADFEKMGMTATARSKSGGKGKEAGKGMTKKSAAKSSSKSASKATVKGTSKTAKKAPAKTAAKGVAARPQPRTVSGNPLESAYARGALKMGLDQHATLGVNPFKLGLIGSTDSHVGLASADEDGYLGKQGVLRTLSATWNAGGYAGVWAHQNSRTSIFDALQRREVYATTGPRMTVRVFGGWDYDAADAAGSDLAGVGYAKGVPMGGDLTNAPKDGSPSFLIRATRDPDGANLDRVQVVKGWRDREGRLAEKVHNVAVSGTRRIDSSGGVKPVGSTVNLKQATYTNSIGDAELSTVWTDPDFDAGEYAFYYVRVLEIPTPRWTAYDVARTGVPLPEQIELVTQERAYTSPIWYTP